MKFSCRAYFYFLISRVCSHFWATEKYPYFKWVGIVVNEKLPRDAGYFYRSVWKRRDLEEGNLQFLNFCKNLINQTDNSLMTEIQSAESINRYLSGMSYSLAFSMLAISIGSLICRCIPEYNWFQQWHFFLIVLYILYFIAFCGIVAHLWFMRIKEVLIVFDATYQRKDLFLSEKSILISR